MSKGRERQKKSYFQFYPRKRAELTSISVKVLLGGGILVAVFVILVMLILFISENVSFFPCSQNNRFTYVGLKKIKFSDLQLLEMK